MIKLVYCFRRRPDLSVEEFSEYWQNVHGPVGARIPGVRKLVQSVSVQDDRHTPAGAFDGMAELWFDDIDALLRARRSARWRASSEDEENSIDPDSAAYFVTMERTIVGS
jgi:uncharacterized protein (TIGR02118 family)